MGNKVWGEQNNFGVKASVHDHLNKEETIQETDIADDVHVLSPENNLLRGRW